MSNVLEFPDQEFTYLTTEKDGETKIRGIKCRSGLLISTDDDGEIIVEASDPLIITKRELISFMLTTNWWAELHEITKPGGN